MLLFCGAAQADGNARYVEIVREKPNCKTAECFVEYMILPSGIAVKKQIDTAAEDAPARMSVRKFPDASSLFAHVTAFFAGSRGSGSRTNDPENIFFYDGEKFYSYGSPDPDAPAYLALFREADEAFEKGTPASDFYTHVYYTPAKGNTKDFHVFSDGTVIASMFGKDTYMIIYTFVSATDAAEVATLRQLGTAAVKAKASDYKKCAPASGLDYGFVEMRIDGSYIRSYTCGDEADSVALLLNHIRGTFDGLQPK